MNKYLRVNHERKYTKKYRSNLKKLLCGRIFGKKNLVKMEKFTPSRVTKSPPSKNMSGKRILRKIPTDSIGQIDRDVKGLEDS